MKKFLLVITLILFSALNSNSQDTHMKETLLNRISEFKEQYKLNAVIAGVWKGGNEILTVALGESMTHVPATTDMHFRIGGVSEMFLGTLLMQIVESGKLNLDDKISKWLPDIPHADEVTVEMLIKNTAGYKDYVYNKDFVDLITNEPFRYITRQEIYKYSIDDGTLNFSPGTQQKYSHTEFTILGDVMEKATGKTVKELFEEYILIPKGLNETGYSVTAEMKHPVIHAFTSDRGIYEDCTYWSPSWTGISGPLYSNLYDLKKWATIFGKGELLTKESFEKLLSKPSVVKEDVYFASGFPVMNGWYFQNPSFNGYAGGFGYFPAEEYTVIVYSTETTDKASSMKAFPLMQELVRIITPDNQINVK